MRKYSLQDRQNALPEEKIVYKKKSSSDVSQAKRKSKHKHDYEECLVTEDGIKFHLASRCVICNKLGDVQFFVVEKIQDSQGRNVSVVMPQDKLMEKYGHLKKYKVEDFFKPREVEGIFEG